MCSHTKKQTSKTVSSFRRPPLTYLLCFMRRRRKEKMHGFPSSGILHEDDTRREQSGTLNNGGLGAGVSSRAVSSSSMTISGADTSIHIRVMESSSGAPGVDFAPWHAAGRSHPLNLRNIAAILDSCIVLQGARNSGSRPLTRISDVPQNG